MNWLAQPASAEAFAGVQGRTVDSLVDDVLRQRLGRALQVARVERADHARLAERERVVAQIVGLSRGRRRAPSVVSSSRSRTVFRYSREVRRRSGIRPAAFGSGGVVEPVPVRSRSKRRHRPSSPRRPSPPSRPAAGPRARHAADRPAAGEAEQGRAGGEPRAAARGRGPRGLTSRADISGLMMCAPSRRRVLR